MAEQPIDKKLMPVGARVYVDYSIGENRWVERGAVIVPPTPDSDGVWIVGVRFDHGTIRPIALDRVRPIPPADQDDPLEMTFTPEQVEALKGNGILVEGINIPEPMPHPGSRRDWFAGMALMGILVRRTIEPSDSYIVTKAVMLADHIIRSLDSTKPE